MNNVMINIETPVENKDINKLKINDKIEITGTIYTGRDTALPKLIKKIQTNQKIDINLNKSIIMHTAVSNAGIAPTTSNKIEIESSIIPLSKEGVKIHIGKGSLNKKTINGLKKENSIFVITPPTAALLTNTIKEKKPIMFKKEGIEAIYELKVEKLPGIVAIKDGKSIF